MITELGNRYGKANVAVRSEYHVQVLTHNRPHDIWINTKEGLKWRLAGSQHTSHGSPEKLLQRLGGWKEQDTDFGKMQGALELSRFIDEVTQMAAGQKVSRAVFCDAGFKNGKARIGIVRIDGEDVTAIRRNVDSPEVKDIDDAEEVAIKAAISLADELDNTMPIYSDSKNAIARVKERRVIWLSRDKNRPADRMANLRQRT